MFWGELEDEEQSFLERIRNFTPKKCFLEIQKVSVNDDVESDAFLGAVAKMRKEQHSKTAKE